MITKAQFAEWKTHPVTIEVYTEIKKVVQDLKDKLSEGATISYEADATHGLTSKMVGQIEGLNQLLNLAYEDEDGNEDSMRERSELFLHG